jgi:hypothetical protein
MLAFPLGPFVRLDRPLAVYNVCGSPGGLAFYSWENIENLARVFGVEGFPKFIYNFLRRLLVLPWRSLTTQG